MSDVFRDFRFELRVLRANPGFAITAIVILALAIAANTAVFACRRVGAKVVSSVCAVTLG